MGVGATTSVEANGQIMNLNKGGQGIFRRAKADSTGSSLRIRQLPARAVSSQSRTCSHPAV